MSSDLLLVYSAPRRGLESDYHCWYDEQHIPEMLALPCIVRAQRFTAVEIGGLASAPRPNLAIYTLAGPSAEAHAALREAERHGLMTYARSLDRRRSLLHYFTARGPAARQTP